MHNSMSLTAAKRYETALLTEAELMDECTCINVATKMSAALQRALLMLLSTNQAYSRILLIIKDEKIATDLLTDVLRFNDTIFNEYMDSYELTKGIYYLRTDASIMNFEEAHTSAHDCLTGFFIDSCKQFVFFMEGPSAGHILTVWNTVMNLQPNVCKIVYNSDLVFNKRLYANSLPTISIFTIALKQPLQTLYAVPLTYLGGSIPSPCWMALRKLNQLLTADLMRIICKDNLLPTLMELYSLTVEFGLPIYYEF